MKKRFQKNISTGGRIVRAVIASVLLAAGFLLPELPLWARIPLLISAAFVAFEAARGWCALRACGIKTRL